MRRRNDFAIVFLICVLLLSGCTKKQSFSVYSYPILPGTEKWAELDGHGAMLDACQLPEEWLKADTASLLACVLTYPLLADAFTSSILGENPVDVLVPDFNGMAELLRRDDMTQIAKEFDIDALTFSEDYQKKIAQRILTLLQSYPDQ